MAKLPWYEKLDLWFCSIRDKQRQIAYRQSIPQRAPDTRDKLRKAIDNAAKEFYGCPKRRNCWKCRDRDNCTFANITENHLRPIVTVKPFAKP